MTTRNRHLRSDRKTALTDAFLVFACLACGLDACSKLAPTRKGDTCWSAPAPENDRSRPSARTIDLRRDAVEHYKRLWNPLAAWLRAMRASPSHLEARHALERVVKTLDPVIEAHQLAAHLEIRDSGSERNRSEVRLVIERREPSHTGARLAVRATLRRSGQSPHTAGKLEHLALDAPFAGLRIVLDSEAGRWRQRVAVGTRSHYTVMAPEARHWIDRLERNWLGAVFELTEPIP